MPNAAKLWQNKTGRLFLCTACGHTQQTKVGGCQFRCECIELVEVAPIDTIERLCLETATPASNAGAHGFALMLLARIGRPRTAPPDPGCEFCKQTFNRPQLGSVPQGWSCPYCHAKYDPCLNVVGPDDPDWKAIPAAISPPPAGCNIEAIRQARR